ncbi:MAG: ATP-binding cassette domain-containing protein [Defluviicoccus sp.]|nr:ATP-binding cassette domain-containing protein [Defluviicoccus sp.]
MSRDALRISGLRVRYAADAEVALAIDALAIAAGERVALIGPSGSGKTTLLRAVHGLVAPEAGTVTLDGVATASAAARSRAFRRRHAAVFQEFQLVERASVLANVLCGRLGHAPVLPSLFGLFAAADREAALAAIEATGLAGYRHRRADTLSGGQRQRVAVARALAQAPSLITADEPVSNLDPVIADDILRALMGSAGENAITVLAAVHHPALATAHADRVIGLAGGAIVHDSADGAALDASALRRIYGRSVAPQIVRDVKPREDGDERSPRNVA